MEKVRTFESEALLGLLGEGFHRQLDICVSNLGMAVGWGFTFGSDRIELVLKTWELTRLLEKAL